MKTKEGYSKSYRINRELLSAYALMEALFIVRPAGRRHLEVEVLYTPGKGKY